MKVYLDNCCIQRPFDDKSQQRIQLEAEVTLVVLDLIAAGDLHLVSSDALLFETGRNVNPTRFSFGVKVLAGARTHIRSNKQVQVRAAELNQKGIGSLDSLHLASAEAANADVFCTCDDILLQKARMEVRGTTNVVSVLKLAEAIAKWQYEQDH